jgi:hypothetical protein
MLICIGQSWLIFYGNDESWFKQKHLGSKPVAFIDILRKPCLFLTKYKHFRSVWGHGQDSQYFLSKVLQTFKALKCQVC